MKIGETEMVFDIPSLKFARLQNGIQSLPYEFKVNGITCEQPQLIYGKNAAAHADFGFEGMYFLNICLKAYHFYADAEHVMKNKRCERVLKTGDIFITDPLIYHWFTYANTKQKEYVLLSFLIDRKKAKKEVNLIMSAINGWWDDRSNSKYLKWMPQP